MEGAVGRHAQGIEVAEEEPVALRRAGAVGASAVAGVAEEPAPALQPKLCPVVAAAVIGLQRHAALPAGRNACNAAQVDEQQRLQSAVALQIHGAVFADIVNLEIIAHEGILHLGGGEFVELPCLAHRLGLIPCQLLRQSAQIGREADERRRFGKVGLLHRQRIGIQRRGGRGAVQRVGITDFADVAVLHAEVFPLVHVPLPAGAAEGRGRIADKIGVALVQSDLALLGRLRRERHVRQIFAGNEQLVVQMERHLDGDGLFEAALLLDFINHRVEPLAHGREGAAGARRERLILDERAVEAHEVALFTLDVDEVDTAFILEAVELLLGEIRHELAHFGDGLLPVPRILRGHAADALLLAHEAVTEHLRHIAFEADINGADCAFKVAGPLALEDILRQRQAERTSNTINGHNESLLLRSLYHTLMRTGREIQQKSSLHASKGKPRLDGAGHSAFAAR